MPVLALSSLSWAESVVCAGTLIIAAVLAGHQRYELAAVEALLAGLLVSQWMRPRRLRLSSPGELIRYPGLWLAWDGTANAIVLNGELSIRDRCLLGRAQQRAVHASHR